jgi:hypothetical protein
VVVPLTAGVDDRCSLEAKAFSQDRVDDVDLDVRVGDGGGRLGRPSGVTVATNPSRCSRTTRCMSAESFMAKRCPAPINESKIE